MSNRICFGMYTGNVFNPKRSLSAALVAAVLIATLGHSQEITVQVEDGKQMILTKRDVHSLPHVSVAVHESDTSATYEGVAVRSLRKSRSSVRGITQGQANGLMFIG